MRSQIKNPVVTILSTIPEYSIVVDRVGFDFLSESWYSALVELFDLAVAAAKSNNRDLLKRIYGLADSLLVDEDVRIQDSTAIEMFDPIIALESQAEIKILRTVVGVHGMAYLKSLQG